MLSNWRHEAEVNIIRISYFTCLSIGIGPPHGTVFSDVGSDFLHLHLHNATGVPFVLSVSNGCLVKTVDVKIDIKSAYVAIVIHRTLDSTEGGWVYLGEIEFLKIGNASGKTCKCLTTNAWSVLMHAAYNMK